jgi:hypothetical protein
LIVAGIRETLSVKPVCGVTFLKGVDLEEVVVRLKDVLGDVDDRTEIFDFSFTDYYREEMGSHLSKAFLSFVDLIHPRNLVGIKCETNLIEESWSVDGKRRVNLDPGYVTGAKLVLVSTKDFAHRIFLGDGIYGDVQLQFRDNCFRVQEWTFPDYQTQTALEFFERVRKKYVREVRHRA